MNISIEARLSCPPAGGEASPAATAPIPGARYSVALLGRAARRALVAPSRWRVVAVFRRSMYLEGTTGALVCLGPISLGGGPLNVLWAPAGGAPWEAADLSPGAAAESDGMTLRVDGRWTFDLAAAGEWRPVPVPPDRDAVTLGGAVRACAAEVVARGPWAGLAPLIPSLAAGPARLGAATPPAPPTLPTPPTPIVGLALPAAWALTGWLARAWSASDRRLGPPSDVATLIGLGPGLTPSGDDLLGGALVALHTLRRPDLARRLAEWLLPRARRRTHAISLAHLVAAAEGEGMAALHATLATLCAPGAPGLRRALDALGAIGHTSGWDALAGAWIVAGVAASSGRGRER